MLNIIIPVILVILSSVYLYKRHHDEKIKKEKEALEEQMKEKDGAETWNDPSNYTEGVKDSDERAEYLLKELKPYFKDSDSIEIRKKSDGSIGFFATKTIKPNTSLSEMLPYITSVVANKGDICDNCAKRDNDRKFRHCQNCVGVYYCSDACEKAKYNEHQYECEFIRGVKGRLEPQTISTFLMVSRLHYKKSIQADEKDKSTGFIKLIKQLYYTKDKRMERFFDPLESPLIAKLQLPVDEYLLRIKSNIENNCSSVGGGYLWSRIIGFYPVQRFIGHSCSPNVAKVYKGQLQCIYTIKPIQKDEEILISHVDERQGIIQRTESIHGLYARKCECTRCTEARESGTIDKYFLCKECNKGRVDVRNGEAKCLECDHVFSTQPLLDKDTEIMTKLSQLQFDTPEEQANIVLKEYQEFYHPLDLGLQLFVNPLLHKPDNTYVISLPRLILALQRRYTVAPHPYHIGFLSYVAQCYWGPKKNQQMGMLINKEVGTSLASYGLDLQKELGAPSTNNNNSGNSSNNQQQQKK